MRLTAGIAVMSLPVLAGPPAQAGGGLFGIDHELSLDQNGIWARSYQTSLEYGVVALEVAGSLWFGNDTEMGHTFWQTVDASTISGVAAAILKDAVGRPRPYRVDNPNQASFVAPFISNYARDNPWIWSLELLPLYDGIARLKSQAHWQSDVIAGWALGTGIGYWSSTRPMPLSVQILPRGLSVGFYKRF